MSRLGYLDEAGAPMIWAAPGVRDLSGFFLRQRGLRRKTITAMRSCLADFLVFSAAAGVTPQGLADRLPPQRHVRHESEPHLWTAAEIRRVLAVIDRASATGKRDYAMILATARLGLRICDLRQLELGDRTGGPSRSGSSSTRRADPCTCRCSMMSAGRSSTTSVAAARKPAARRCSSASSPVRRVPGAPPRSARGSRGMLPAWIVFGPGEVCGMHSLRSALAVAMVGNGAPMPVVSAVSGHASSDTTQAYYLRFDVSNT